MYYLCSGLHLPFQSNHYDFRTNVSIYMKLPLMKYLRKFKELILIRTWLIGEGKLSRLIAARVLKSHCIYFENLWVIRNEVF